MVYFLEKYVKSHQHQLLQVKVVLVGRRRVNPNRSLASRDFHRHRQLVRRLALERHCLCYLNMDGTYFDQSVSQFDYFGKYRWRIEIHLSSQRSSPSHQFCTKTSSTTSPMLNRWAFTLKIFLNSLKTYIN